MKLLIIENTGRPSSFRNLLLMEGVSWFVGRKVVLSGEIKRRLLSGLFAMLLYFIGMFL